MREFSPPDHRLPEIMGGFIQFAQIAGIMPHTRRRVDHAFVMGGGEIFAHHAENRLADYYQDD